jgi:TolB-like protein/Tfp pilus assembly protein PilF
MSFLGEIKRRKIFQVAVVYAVVAWLLIQIVATIEEPLNLPSWLDTTVIVLLAVGFPITLIMSWGFNLTPEGLVRDSGDVSAPERTRLSIELVLIAVLVVAVSWLYFRDFGESDEGLTIDRPAVDSVVESDTTNRPLPNSIAVLPFENLSPDPDNAYFAAGIHDSTLNQLAKIGDLVVLSRSSVLQYEKDRPPIAQVAKELNVETVMEGSVRYANGRVLITAQLIDGKTDAHLWSEEFNKELTDVFAVQAEVARNIATAMRVRFLPDEQARIGSRPTESAEAYQHYLYALSLPDIQVFPENRLASIEALGRAIAADPEFGDAYAALALAYYASPRTRQRAVDYAQKAIEMDPAIGKAYYVLGMSNRYYHARQDEARVAFQRAVDLSPNDPHISIRAARQLAELTGQYADAIRIGERVVSIAPRVGNENQLGLIYLRAGRLKAAVRHLREGIRLEPGNYVDHLDLATAQYLIGDRNTAKDNLDLATQLMSPTQTLRADYITYLYGLLDDTTHARQYLQERNLKYDIPVDDASEEVGWALLGTRDKEIALRGWARIIDGYINDDRPVSTGRITRFRDNWLNDAMLEEPEFLELRRRLGFQG